MEQLPFSQDERNSEISNLLTSLDSPKVPPKIQQTQNPKAHHQESHDQNIIPEQQGQKESFQKEIELLKMQLKQLKYYSLSKREKIAAKIEIVEKETRVIEETLATARQKVETLKIRDLMHVRSFQNPPPLIEIVFKAIYYLLRKSINNLPLRRQERNAATWPQLTSLVRDTLYSQIKLLQIEEVHQDVIHFVLKEYISSQKWDINRIAKFSVDAGKLAEWVEAFVHGANLLMRVRPVTKQIAYLNEQLNEYQRKIQILNEQIALKNRKLDKIEQAQRIKKQSNSNNNFAQ